MKQGSLARKDLWYEAALLKKLLYKSKNQHRSSKHFQYLTQVRAEARMRADLRVSNHQIKTSRHFAWLRGR